MDLDSPYLGLMEFLQQLPTDVVDLIYDFSAVCVGIYQSLSPVAKVLINRLLLVEFPVSEVAVHTWFKESARKRLKQAIDELRLLRIVHGLHTLLIHRAFASSLRSYVAGGDVNHAFVPGEIDPKHEKTPAELMAYGKQRWECVLYFLALSSSTTEASESQTVSTECREILASSGFINIDSPSGSVEITSKGFRFLLMEPHVQIWAYLVLYLTYLGAYSSENFSQELQDFLQHLREIGLVFQAKRKLMRFFPTHLGVRLLSRDSSLSLTETDGAQSGFMLVETNFRIYAYTASNLMLAIVSTFAEMTYRFTGLSVGILTRESARKAFQAGITAEQIIDFIRSNAHVAMKSNIPLIPPNITDQLRLWEQERERFHFQSGVLYEKFHSDADFELVRDYASREGHLMWDRQAIRTLVVHPEGHDDVRTFWRSQKKD